VTIDVYEAKRPNGEIWYRVKANGRDLEAEWADPDAARRRAERYLRETRGRGGTKMETETPDQPAIPEPDEPETPEVEPETEPAEKPEENGDDGED
jgi:hypothetical protein